MKDTYIRLSIIRIMLWETDLELNVCAPEWGVLPDCFYPSLIALGPSIPKSTPSASPICKPVSLHSVLSQQTALSGAYRIAPNLGENRDLTCSATTLSRRMRKSTSSLLSEPISSFTFFKSSEIPGCKAAASLRPLLKKIKGTPKIVWWPTVGTMLCSTLEISFNFHNPMSWAVLFPLKRWVKWGSKMSNDF